MVHSDEQLAVQRRDLRDNIDQRTRRSELVQAIRSARLRGTARAQAVDFLSAAATRQRTSLDGARLLVHAARDVRTFEDVADVLTRCAPLFVRRSR